MKNLLTKLRYVPKRFGVVAAVVVAGATAAMGFAWGPDRPTFTTASPAPYITFNSITDNPAYGDERNFMRVKPADAPNSAYSDRTTLQAGKEYQVYIYFHNNAAANLNLVATNTTVQTQLPAVVNGDTQSVSYINSPDAKPMKVWDETTLTSTSPVAIRMVPGSATIHSFGAVDGAKLPDSIITTGAPLGYNALDGKVPGCNQYAGYVTFNFVADQPNFEVGKLVSKHGANTWTESYKAQPGEIVDYLLKYKNTGTTVQNDVVIKDTLPAGMTYVAGSTKLGNPTHPAGVLASDNVTTTGINVGNYGPGQNAWVTFSAKTPADAALVCGTNKLINKETVITKNGSKEDTAEVVIDKYCAPEPKYTCGMLTVNKIDRTHFSFKTDYTVQNATFVRVDYVVRNAAGSEVYRGTNNTFTTNTVGNYTVEALVVVTVNGATKTVTGANCKKPFTVEEEPVTPVAACKQVTVNTISRTEFSFDGAATVSGGATVSKYTFIVKNAAGQTVATKEVATNTLTANSGKVTLTTVGTYTVVLTVATSEGNKTNNNCMKTFEVKPEDKDITVCRLSDKKYPVTIKQSAFDATKYSMNPDDCKVLEASYIKVCNLADWTIKTIKESEFDATKHSKNLDDCKEKVCVKDTKQIITINKNEFDATKQTRDLTVCNPTPTPETPTTIASTGPEAILGGLFGSSALGLGISSYVRSRAAVRSALRR